MVPNLPPRFSDDFCDLQIIRSTAMRWWYNIQPKSKHVSDGYDEIRFTPLPDEVENRPDPDIGMSTFPDYRLFCQLVRETLDVENPLSALKSGPVKIRLCIPGFDIAELLPTWPPNMRVTTSNLYLRVCGVVFRWLRSVHANPKRYIPSLRSQDAHDALFSHYGHGSFFKRLGPAENIAGVLLGHLRLVALRHVGDSTWATVFELDLGKVGTNAPRLPVGICSTCGAAMWSDDFWEAHDELASCRPRVRRASTASGTIDLCT